MSKSILVRRRLRTLSLVALACGALSLGAIACATGDGAAGGSGGAGGEPAKPQGVACAATMSCSPGSVCHNGACAKGCNRDQDCGDGEYCALDAGQLCQPKAPANCPTVPCASTQACVEGLCGTQLGQGCGPSPFTDSDGCPESAICLSQMSVNGTSVEAAQCYTLPACGPDGSCPVGAHGALCTGGLLDDKDPVCLPGACLGTSNCPTSTKCIRMQSTQLYGRCSDGGAGSLCATGADCGSSMCVIATPGLFGTCK